MQNLLDVILPVFLVIGFGYVVSWRGLFSESAVEGVMRFAQNFAVPVLLARSIARLDLHAGYDAGLMLSFYIGAFASFGIGLLGARYLFNRPATDCVAIGFCCLFSNSLLLGIPITERAYGTAALTGNFAIISIHSPMLYTIGITMMEAVRSRGSANSLPQVALKALAGVLRTPLVLGILCGFVIQALAALGLDLPKPIWSAMDMMAAAALPAALFGLGGVLFRYRPEGDVQPIVMVTLCSLVVHPGIAYLLARYAFHLDTAGLRSAVMTAAMAPGVNAYLFANMYGVAKRVSASSVLVATAVSVLTIWIWLAILP
ncbi:AEC family transporter [Phaeovulum sp. W22_SRMD_FR3]|uniref:AEC family transporter n=1 Tax=Phaeovulum sp. W22_SRMD_FR3 TaxID=3240274 RepID=UPI003F9D572A